MKASLHPYHFVHRRIIIISIVIIAGVLQWKSLYAQSPLLQNITIQFTGETLAEALQKIELQTDLTFAYSNDLLPKRKKYRLYFNDTPVREVINTLLESADLEFEFVGNQVIIQKIQYFEVFGIIRDATSKEALVAANAYVGNSDIGVAANEYGYYSVKLRKGAHQLVFSYLGMKTAIKNIIVNQKTRLNIDLEANKIELEEIIVDQKKDMIAVANAPANEQAILEMAENTPHIGGEPDLLHIIRAQSGVQSSAGGIGGLYVRGGNTGHNLVLLDGVPVYNWMHLLGVNSIFNPNAVRGVQFYKGGFSARYGGRLASVLDIQSKAGNSERFAGMFGISPRSYQGHLSGALFNKNGAFWLGGRRSFLMPYIEDVIEETFFKDRNTSGVAPSYYDFNIKLNQALGLNDRIYLSFYQGRDNITGETEYIENIEEEDDIFQVKESIENTLFYGNTVAALRWNHIYNNQLFSNLILNYSRFTNQFNHLIYIQRLDEPDEEDFTYWDIRSDNTELALKLDFDWISNKHYIKFGAALHGYSFEPFIGLFDDASDEDDWDEEDLEIDSFAQRVNPIRNSALHTAWYIEDDFKITPKTMLRVGARFTTYRTEAKNDDEAPFFYNIEPRILLTTSVTPKFKLAFSATRMVQYLQLVSNTDIGLPQDLWLSSEAGYPPATAWQVGADAHLKLGEHSRLQFSIFNKWMDNIVTLPDTITPTQFGTEISGQILGGAGTSTGAEAAWYFKKAKWSGLLAYTLSWSERNFEDINNTQNYPFSFDSRHYAQFLVSYDLSQHWQMSLRGHWSTPRPLLVSPYASIETGLEIIDIDPVGQRNSTRGSPEHRLDWNISYLYTTSQKVEHRASFEVYNTYNQSNPIFYYSEVDNEQGDNIPGMQLPLMLSLYYAVKF